MSASRDVRSRFPTSRAQIAPNCNQFATQDVDLDQRETNYLIANVERKSLRIKLLETKSVLRLLEFESARSGEISDDSLEIVKKCRLQKLDIRSTAELYCVAC